MKKRNRIEYNRKYYSENKEKIDTQKKDWEKKNPEKMLKSNLKRRLKHKYNLTIEQFFEIFSKQNNSCANLACKKLLFWPGKDTCIDHCHKTGKVRGVLCRSCNTSSGQVKDDPVILRGLAEYLEAHE